jgi:hypothetical protein
MLLLAILFSLAFRGSARRAADRQVSLLKSKLLERDEEIERLRYRVRHGSLPPEEAAEPEAEATHPLLATEAEQQ